MKKEIHENGTIEISSTLFGICIRAQRSNHPIWDEEAEMWNVRTTFCEDKHEFDFEYQRTLEWLNNTSL